MSEVVRYRSENLKFKQADGVWYVYDIVVKKYVSFFIDSKGFVTFNPCHKGFHYQEALETICYYMRGVKLIVMCSQNSRKDMILRKVSTFQQVPASGVVTRIYYSV